MASDHPLEHEVRTSLSHPLRIATLPIGAKGGAVGVTFAPGKRQASAMTGVWERDIDHDLMVIRQWGASDLVTLLEPHEFIELGIADLPQRAAMHGLRWHGLPITDGAAPDSRFLTPWRALFPALLRNIDGGQRVIVHCKGGLGRAGTVACLLLLSSGASPDAKSAIAQVRSVRPGAIETLMQEEFIAHWLDAKDSSDHHSMTAP